MNDALFDAKLKEALLLAVTVDYAEILSEPDGAEPPWTLPYRRQRKKMLTDPNKWCRDRVRPIWKKALYRAACVLLAATLTLGSLMAVSPTVRAWVFSWFHSFDANDNVHYFPSGTAAEHPATHDKHPQWRPTWLPEGWVINGMSGWIGDDSVRWGYESADGVDSLSFRCRYDSVDAMLGLGSREEDMSEVYEMAQVWGSSADYYGGEDSADLVWQGEDGIFFHLDVLSENPELCSKEFLERVAESVEWYQGTEYRYDVGFIPEGYVLKESGRYSPNPYELDASGKCYWVTEGGSLTFLYTESQAAPIRSGDSEPISFKIGNHRYEGRYYAPTTEYFPFMQDNTPEPTVEVIDGKFKVTYPEYDPADYPPTVRTDAVYPNDMCGAICWTNEDGVQMMVVGTLDKETLLKVAESITPRAFLTEGD